MREDEGAEAAVLEELVEETTPDQDPVPESPAGERRGSAPDSGGGGCGWWGPRNKQDLVRQRARGSVELPDGRVVLPQTAGNRAKLLDSLGEWLAQRGQSLDAALSSKETDMDTLLQWLVSYGRELFSAGYTYWRYAETINSVAAKRSWARRQLQAAWDLAFSWLALEPGSHRIAMPAVVLLALLSVNLLWEWRSEAGVYALTFGALLRIGEAIQATCCSLVLPRDVLRIHSYVLLRIHEPKTRLRAARHQAAKLEASDLVELVDVAFAHLPSGSRIWPLSAQTLRRRFDTALERLGIPTARTHHRPLDLGSFRPGGATHLLQLTEDAELVRRRGRWVSNKVMEIYLQEIAAATYFPNLPKDVRENVLFNAHAFPDILKQSAAWTRAAIPTSAWYHLWLRKDTTCTGFKRGGYG